MIIAGKYCFPALIATAIFGLTAPVQAAPIVINGSLTGTIANNSLPPGWTVLGVYPDTMDENSNLGFPGFQQFGVAPSGPSPDGGTWVGLAAYQGITEAFGQTVHGFEIGKQYTLSWYAGNFGYTPDPVFNQYINPNAIRVAFDGIDGGAGQTIALGPDWFLQSITFTASGAASLIEFGLMDASVPSHMSIDGISVVEVAAPTEVPEPLSMSLFAAGVAALATIRRRRAARRNLSRME